MHSFADTIWANARIYTMNSHQPWASTLACAGKTILYCGQETDLGALTDRNTQIIDLEGRFVMPGIVDSHLHGIWGAMRDLYEIYVGYDASLDELLATVAKRCESADYDHWITGGPWRLDQRQGMGQGRDVPPRITLDRHSGDIPVVLKDATLHSVWLNSKAIALSGIDQLDPDQYGNLIERDTQGKPNGILHEGACHQVQAMTLPDDKQREKAVAYLGEHLNSLGITACKEAMAGETDLQAYYNADVNGVMKLHLATHICRRSPKNEDDVDVHQMIEWSKKYRGPHMHTQFAKIFLDGVAPSLTASFLEPYLTCGCGTAGAFHPDATMRYSREALGQEVSLLDKHGFTLKMHAVGDHAVRAGLDGIQVAREKNGNSDLRHEIAHTAFVHTDDMARFAKLNAVAEMSPKLWFPNAITQGQIEVLGADRVHRCHPIKSLLEAGAEVTYGSDWPAAAPDANPWVGLAGMVSRQHPLGWYPGSVGPDQAIPLERAIPLFTINGARSLGLEGVTGSLEAGKSADFIVMKESLFDMTPEQIGRNEVETTVFEGDVVYGERYE